MPQFPTLRAQGIFRRRQPPQTHAVQIAQDPAHLQKFCDSLRRLDALAFNAAAAPPSSPPVVTELMEDVEFDSVLLDLRDCSSAGGSVDSTGGSSLARSSMSAIASLTRDGRAALHQWEDQSLPVASSASPSRGEHTPSSPRESGIISRFPHAWVPAGTAAWRCTQCSSMATGCPVKPHGGACAGLPSAMVKAKGKGHDLWKFDPISGSPLAAYVCCRACGASGSQQAWQNLACGCPGKWTSTTTKAAWSRLNVGKHPHPRHGNRQHFFAGVPMPGCGTSV